MKKQAFSFVAMIIAYGLGGVCCFMAWGFSILVGVLPLEARQREHITRKAIRRLAGLWVRVLEVMGILDVDFGGIDQQCVRHGLVLVANHPTYLDAVLLMSIIPNLFCLTKAGNLERFWISVTARQAGYVDNGNALRMVRECIARIQREENLLIFPEGTRTTGVQVKNLKRGFAYIAIKARVPLVVIRVTSFNEAFMRKGHPFFSASPRIPMRYRFENLGEIIPNCRDSSRCLTDRVEHMMRGVL